MGQLTPSEAAKQMLPGLRTEFMKQYKGVPLSYQRVTLSVPSNQLEETYGWLGQLPMLRKMGAERMPKGLSEYKHVIKNEKWESSIRVDNDLLRFEKYGQVKALVGGLGQSIPKGKNKAIWQLFAAGFSTTGYDGQYFFDTDHSEGDSGTQSNLLTTALSASSYAAARARIRSFKDDRGEFTGHGFGGLLLVVPPTLEETALKIVNSSLISDGGAAVDNPWKGTADVVVVPWLGDSNDWFLVDEDAYIAPIILQEVNPTTAFGIVTDTKGGDEDFMRDHTSFGTPIVHFGAGFGDWRAAIGNQVA